MFIILELFLRYFVFNYVAKLRTYQFYLSEKHFIAATILGGSRILNY